jgi:beta-xylosidase
MTQATFRNPVHPEYFADPFVLRHGDTWYAYGTGPEGDAAAAENDGRVFDIRRSTDLVRWERLGCALEALNLPPLEEPDRYEYWAPEVVEAEGRFLMYYSMGIQDRGHRIRVAAANRPEGPFRDLGRELTPNERFAIDAHPFRDDDGTWYLYFARDVLEGDRVGTSLAVDRMTDMTTLAGEARTVLAPTADWQLYRRQRPMYDAVYDWHTLEGPFVRKRHGRYWLLYSGGAWTEPGYGVSFAVAESPVGPFIEPRPGEPSLLRSVPGRLLGPGHCSIVQGPDGADWLVYHAWDPDHTARRMCLDRIEWTPDGPRTSGPTWEAQPVPETGRPPRTGPPGR